MSVVLNLSSISVTYISVIGFGSIATVSISFSNVRVKDSVCVEMCDVCELHGSVSVSDCN